MSRVQLPGGHIILACKVFSPELSLLGIPPERIHYLDQGLHSHPDMLREKVAGSLAQLEDRDNVSTVILLYGYCGGGLKGLSSERLKLVVPAIHDCIPLLLGGYPPKCSADVGQSYYLSAGWIDHGQTPLTEHMKNVEKFGEEDALWVGRKILAGYSRITLITSELTTEPRYQEHARQSARLFDLDYEEIPGSLSWLSCLLTGAKTPDVLVLQPREKVTLSMFLRGEPSVQKPSLYEV